ncbi:hypothetical protein J6590_069754 [Homalodisca vitripennis]|nr:hypothetical protein J6590_069754 [Homalodisca vitripennis]
MVYHPILSSGQTPDIVGYDCRMRKAYEQVDRARHRSIAISTECVPAIPKAFSELKILQETQCIIKDIIVFGA